MTVYYSDGHGASKQAQSVQTAAIVDVPPAPALEAVAGDGQVALTWTAPSSDGGSPILRYQVRYLEAVLRPWVTQVVTGWKVVPGGAAARDTTIGGLTNGTAYIFRVLAENGVGSGARAEKTATPKAPLCPITGPTAPTVAENTATTEAVATYTVSGDDCGSAVVVGVGGYGCVRLRCRDRARRGRCTLLPPPITRPRVATRSRCGCKWDRRKRAPAGEGVGVQCR